jgi:ionotropic kainate glutamate receptor 2
VKVLRKGAGISKYEKKKNSQNKKTSCDQVPTPTPTRLFSFMNPLAVEIWLFLLLAYVLVSLSMWVVARFTPYEWHDNVNGSGLGSRCHHCHHYLSGSISGGINQIMQQQQQQQNHHHHQQQHQLNHDALFSSDQPVLASSNDFSLANSFWFTIGTLMQQGSDLNPKVFRCSAAVAV